MTSKLLEREHILNWLQHPVTITVMELLKDKRNMITADLVNGESLYNLDSTGIIKETALKVGCLKILELVSDIDGISKLFNIDLTINE